MAAGHLLYKWVWLVSQLELGEERWAKWQKLGEAVESGCQGASDPENTRKSEMGEVWITGEYIIILFFLVVIPCLKSVFIAPCFQFMCLSLATAPETWAGRERLEQPVPAPVGQPKSC